MVVEGEVTNRSLKSSVDLRGSIREPVTWCHRGVGASLSPFYVVSSACYSQYVSQCAWRVSAPWRVSIMPAAFTSLPHIIKVRDVAQLVCKA